MITHESTGHAMNRKSLRPQSVKPVRAQWWATPAAFMVSLLALPANALNIPTDPLASGVRVAPNILFILDDSGSMARPYMPDDVPKVGATAAGSGTHGDCDSFMSSTDTAYLACNAYTRNTIYYNPAVDYEPWTDATGLALSGGTSYTSVYSDDQDVNYTGVNDANTSNVSITTSATIDLSAATQTFYVPKDTIQTAESYLGVGTNYYRYQILTDGSIYRSEYLNYNSGTTPVPAAVTGTLGTQGNTLSGNYSATWSITVPAGAYVEFTSSGGTTTGRGADLYVRYNNATVSTGNYDQRSRVNGNAETVVFAEPAAGGTYYVRLNAGSAFNGPVTVTYRYIDSKGCAITTSGYGWRKCQADRPSVPTSVVAAGKRSAADEMENFATWYSYYRTRIKAAKGGAADAFSNPALGNKVRVGYTSIWDDNPFYIPVDDLNDGRFVNNNGSNGNPATKSRAKWYSHLFAAGGSGRTPLQPALNRAGQYYSDSYTGKTGATGPYGPETGGLTFSCRQNFTILTTDGYWNDTTVDVSAEGDNANGGVITNGFPVGDPKRKSFQYTPSAPYQASASPTLADVAMKYWKKDLMTGLDNNVPSSYPSNARGDDPAFWQHMVTFGISIGLSGTSGWSSVAAVPNNATWNDPTDAEDSDRIDDLLHAALNGRGNFVAATSPQAFSDGLAAALAKINEVTSAFSNASASDSTQVAAGSKIFKASYRSGRWTGVLTAISAVDGTKQWATTDAGKIPAYGSRNIYTRSGTVTAGVGGNGIGGGTTFPDTSYQLPLLGRTGGPANYAVTATDNADYLKGRQTNEGATLGKLRIRSTVLGDIVDSSPAYVADTDTVYIGANDGMMHAFNAQTGVELFAYVPNIINFGQLAELSRGDYEHRWFVDGPIAVSTRSVGPSNTNILVGTLGRGGKGLYALDVTNPSTFSASNVKWERNETAGNNMGLVLGTPVLGQVRNGANTSAVVIGNGPNSTSGKAVLVVLNLADGSVIKEIDTSQFSGPTANNGLFTPTGVYAADGKTLIYAYAGDLQGNLWKFNMTSSVTDNWTATKIFHAEKTTGTPQPITSGVAVAVDPRNNKRWVFFSTGSFITDADANDKSAGAQSMYGVMDDGASYTRSDLTARTVSISGSNRSFQDLATLSNKGWYVDLPGIGERIVQNAQIDGAFLITASMLPSGNSCDTAQGSGYINAISVFDGIATGKSYFDLDGNGSTDDSGTGGLPTGSVLTNGMPTLPLLMPGQVRGITSASENNDYNFTKGRPTWNRVSWRELRKD
jgi:type IV pilus assembly protein PilY1